MAHGQVHTLPSRALSAFHRLSRLCEPHGGKILALHRRDGGVAARAAAVPLHRRAPFCKKAGRVFLSNVRVPRLESRFRGAQPVAGENVPRRGTVRRAFHAVSLCAHGARHSPLGTEKDHLCPCVRSKRISLLRRGALADRGREPARAVPERLALCRRGNALFRHVSRHGGQYPDPRLRAFARGAGARIYGGQKARVRSSSAAPGGNGALCPVPERMLVRVGRAARLMRADAAEARARTAAEVYSGGGGRFGADHAARGVFLSGAERDAV